MGHASSKDVFTRLGRKIDNLHVRCPWNRELYNILKELFSEKEAEVFIKLPYVFSDLERINTIIPCDKHELRKTLDRLCDKGLVVDILKNDRYFYMPSPMVIGIFEFTMMRTGDTVNSKELGRLFHEYFDSSEAFYSANLGHGRMISHARALPHGEALLKSGTTAILDFESAEKIVDSSSMCAMGICSCRHAAMHAGARTCDAGLDTCASFGWAAEYLVRHRMAREIPKKEMADSLISSKEKGLVLCADNVKKNVTFICQCCSCCCSMMRGINKYGYSNTIITSGYSPVVNPDSCTGCGQCKKACPVGAIEITASGSFPADKIKWAGIDREFCLGCGLCALRCKPGAIRMVRKKRRAILPESTFERVLLQCIGLGTIQNQIFDNPESLPHSFMRGLLGGFLRLPPAKMIVLSSALESRFFISPFVTAARQVLKRKGKDWIADL